MAIAFTGLPGPAPRKIFSKIFSVRGTIPVPVVITSREVLGVPVHWDPKAGLHGKAVACKSGYCPYHAAGLPVRWRGYISGLCAPKWTHQLIELTDGAARALAQLLHLNEQPESTSIRGTAIVLRRRTKSATSPMDVALYDRKPQVAMLPEPLNVRLLVSNIWSSDKGIEMVEGPFDP